MTGIETVLQRGSRCPRCNGSLLPEQFEDVKTLKCFQMRARVDTGFIDLGSGHGSRLPPPDPHGCRRLTVGLSSAGSSGGGKRLPSTRVDVEPRKVSGITPEAAYVSVR